MTKAIIAAVVVALVVGTVLIVRSRAESPESSRVAA